jgi:hypothetical protein
MLAGIGFALGACFGCGGRLLCHSGDRCLETVQRLFKSWLIGRQLDGRTSVFESSIELPLPAQQLSKQVVNTHTGVIFGEPRTQQSDRALIIPVARLRIRSLEAEQAVSRR